MTYWPSPAKILPTSVSAPLSIDCSNSNSYPTPLLTSSVEQPEPSVGQRLTETHVGTMVFDVTSSDKQASVVPVASEAFSVPPSNKVNVSPPLSVSLFFIASFTFVSAPLPPATNRVCPADAIPKTLLLIKLPIAVSFVQSTPLPLYI